MIIKKQILWGALLLGILFLASWVFDGFLENWSWGTIDRSLFLGSIFALGGYGLWKRQKGLKTALNDFSQMQQTILAKLDGLEKKEAEHGTVASELKIVHQLIERLNLEIQSQDTAASACDVSEAEKVFTPQSSDGPALSRQRLVETLYDSVKNNRIDMLLQPIVSLPQRKIRYFETFSRIQDESGTFIIADDYIDIAKQETVIRLIDHFLLFRCLQLVRKTIKKQYDIGFFCNLSLVSLSDQSFLDSFIEFISENRSLVASVIFEFQEEAIPMLKKDLVDVLGQLSSLGCRFSVDQVTDLNIDLQWLEKNKFKFIKIDAETFLTALKKLNTSSVISDLKKSADAHGIDIILTKIETEKELVDLLDFNFDFGQGYLFSAPRTSAKW